MKSHNAMKDAEAVDAGWEATRGAIYGALKWGAVTAALGGLGHAVSPVYRGLTIQFKVYVCHDGVQDTLAATRVTSYIMRHCIHGLTMVECSQLHANVGHGLRQHD